MAITRVCNNVDVSTIIKHIRKKKKLTQEKFGKRIKVTHQTVNAYEKGRIQPSLDVFLKILNVGGYALELKEDIYKTPKDIYLPDA